MTKSRAVILAAMILSVISLAPLSASMTSGSIQMKPAIIPPVNTAILVDPSGTYMFYNVTSTSFMMNVASYEALLHDPYSTPPTGTTQIVGNMVNVSTASRPSPPHFPTVYSFNWAGAGGGDCTSMTVGTGLHCNGSKGTLGTAGVYSASLTWQPSCYYYTACSTSLWAGLSPQDSANSPLVQNGMDVCINDLAGCSYGGHNGQSGSQSWEAWDECYVSPSNDQTTWTKTNPTTINGVAYEFNFAFVSSKTQPTFAWMVGSWNYYYTDTTSNCPQTDFQQSEGIMEQMINPEQMILWSPNPNIMTGWWETGNWCGCTYQSGYLGSSYQVGQYWLTSNGKSSGTLIADGIIYSSTQFEVGIL